jgi:hypothetical protein
MFGRKTRAWAFAGTLLVPAALAGCGGSSAAGSSAAKQAESQALKALAPTLSSARPDRGGSAGCERAAGLPGG